MQQLSRVGRDWVEAAHSAFQVAAQMPSSFTSEEIQHLFEQVEEGNGIPADKADSSELATIRNQTGESLLIVAARIGNVEIAKKMLTFPDMDKDETDNEGWSALLCAAHSGHFEIVRVLLEAGCSVDQPDQLGWTALMWSVYKNHPEILDLLLLHGAHANLLDEEDCLTPLIIASGRGYIDCVRVLLAHDAQVNACDKFGSTALIWACRKGHFQIVNMLLNAGASVNAIGMLSWTALMMATRGNYIQIVELLLSRDPNVDVADQSGITALGIAARDGYGEILDALIKSNAQVNQCDRFGLSILHAATRSGNVANVKLLLARHANLNVQDCEGRTPLHIAVDKSYLDIVLLFLSNSSAPNLELRNKDGDTALLRAVKSRHVAMCEILVKAGAKISATDNEGDNVLHLALRARSRRLATVLLTNPQDSRLLYRPNKLGQTPYSIDQESPQPILPLIFGPVDADQHLDAMMGYDIYSNVIADILCEPNLQLPLTLGLYAKWGSGKSVLLQKIKESMTSFSRNWLDGVQLRWSMHVVLYMLLILLLITTSVAAAVAVNQSVELLVAIFVIGFAIFGSCTSVYSVVHYGSSKKMWVSYMSVAEYIARAFAHIRLLFDVIMLHAPERSEKDITSFPVSFLFADYHRLSSIGGEQALAKIVVTLFEAAENHYGVLPVRLFCALRHNYLPSSQGSFRRHCGVPIILISALMYILLILGEAFLTSWLFTDRNIYSSSSSGLLYAATVFLSLFLIFSIYPLFLFLKYAFTNIPKRRIKRAARAVHKIRFEGLMQKLQTEVDLLTDMVRSLDAFTNSQTRLVLIVDGLDNCEQERLVSTLDSLELLFTARKTRPFVLVIAVDPHIIITAINHNIHSALSGTELTGADYLKNIVNMPFFLHNSALRQLQNRLRQNRESLWEWKDRFKRQDTFHGSHLSLRDADMRMQRKQTMVVGTRNVGEALMADDYFSSLNPRAMRRIVNALTLTGRLLRAFEIEFTWVALGHWVSMLEQWPCRMCWLIEYAIEARNPSLTLYDIYIQLKDSIPNTDPIFVQDRNPENFESFLQGVSAENSPDALNVGTIKRFVPCSSNLDPYLRKLIREKRSGNADLLLDKKAFGLPAFAKNLFADEKSWQLVDAPLINMKVSQITTLIKRLDIPPKRTEQIIEQFEQLNLNGLVLSTCQFSELQAELQLKLGDWVLIKLLIETLRSFGTNVPGVKVEKRITTVVQEEEEEEDDDEENDDQFSEGEISVSRRTSMSRAASMSGPVPLGMLGRKRTVISELASQMTMDGQHDVLMASLADMDAQETEGDIEQVTPSSVASVHFGDDGVATSRDSTESNFGSSDNLLIDEENEPMLSRHPSTRGELMSRIHRGSVHSENGALGSRTNSFMDGSQHSIDDGHQLTVLRRSQNDREREPLNEIFRRGSPSDNA